MKKLTLLVMSLVLGFGLMAQVPTELPDDFEAYTVGQKLAEQNPTLWTTWSNAPGGDEDPIISDEVASNGTNSVKITAGNDCVLPLGDLTEGNYTVKFKVLVPTGYIGYYNILHAFDGANSEWGTQTYFGADGAGRIDGGAEGAGTFTFAYDTWITVENKINLTFDQATVAIDGVDIITWQWSMGTFGEPGLNQLGAANFYAWDEEGTPTMYIDEVELIDNSGVTAGPPPANLTGMVIDDFYVQLDWEAPGAAPMVWNQLDALGETYGKSAQDFESAYDVYDAEVAADFVLEETTALNAVAVRYFYNAAHSGNTDPRVINVSFFADESGLPGETALYTTTTVEATPDEEGVFTADLNDIITLDAGTYWIGYNMQLDYGTDEIQCYAGQRASVENETAAYWRNPGDGFETGFTMWSPDVTSEGGDPEEVCFALWGAPATAADLANMSNFNNVVVEKNYQTVSLNVNTSAKGNSVAPYTMGNRELLGYNVYRNGEVVAEEISALTFLDGALDPGMYNYLVTAVYPEGESDPAGPLPMEITAGVPAANITPPVLNGGLVYYPQTTDKSINIANDGNGDLMYEIYATYNTDEKTAAVKPYIFTKAPEGIGELVSANSNYKPSYDGGMTREMLWDNADINVGTGGLISGGYGGFGAEDNLVNVADDFIVPNGESWTIEFIHTEGFTTETAPVDPDGFGVIIYSDAFGAPGEVIYEEIVPWTNYEAQDLVLAMPPALSSGHYWLSVYGWFADATATENHRWNWYYGTTAIGHEAVLQDQPALFGGMNWTQISNLLDGASMFFVIEGTKTVTDNWLSFDPQAGTVLPLENQDIAVTIDPMGILEPSNTQYSGNIVVYTNDPELPVKTIPVAMQLTSVGIGEEEATYVMVYPNPTNGVMNIEANEMIQSVRVMNLAGQTIISTAVDAERYQINASDLETGIYFVQIETASGIATQRVTVQ